MCLFSSVMQTQELDFGRIQKFMRLYIGTFEFSQITLSVSLRTGFPAHSDVRRCLQLPPLSLTPHPNLFRRLSRE